MALHEIHWEVTNRCNLRCKHCLSMSGKPRENELSTEEALVALEEFFSAGVTRICFTGGEPFIRPDFLLILQRAAELGIRTEVITNATMLNEEVLEVIKELGIKLGISLDGAEPVTNDTLRGKDVYERVIKVFYECQYRFIPTMLYVTVNEGNIQQLRQFCMIAQKYSCESIHFSEVTFAGRALKFLPELKLSEGERCELPKIIAHLATDIFGERLSVMDDSCWVDGETLFMTADGNLYLCTEIFQHRPDSMVGNIRSFSSRYLRNFTLSFVRQQKRCCYGLQASEHMTFIYNLGSKCALITEEPERIETLEQLYGELDRFYEGISRDCRECQDLDCVGYVWLLEEEADYLYERGVPIIQVNNGPSFIHSFPLTSQGEFDVSVRYPRCSQLCLGNRRCSIYCYRPLMCRFYPIGLETRLDGIIVLALHLDCLYVRRLQESGLLSSFKHRASNLFERISPQLLNEIVATYRAVHAISIFPDGENNYCTLKEVSGHV